MKQQKGRGMSLREIPIGSFSFSSTKHPTLDSAAVAMAPTTHKIEALSRRNNSAVATLNETTSRAVDPITV
jgi:hypothetical protein